MVGGDQNINKMLGSMPDDIEKGGMRKSFCLLRTPGVLAFKVSVRKCK